MGHHADNRADPFADRSWHLERENRMNPKLYILFGTGTDAVGLVQKITTPIARIKGNIIDLRQDVLHGLFTIFLVLDLSEVTQSLEDVEQLVAEIAEETGLDLALDKYTPVPRSAEKKNLLMIMVGRDKPGIIATVSEILSTYRINVEFSQMIARENIFLMELMADIGPSVLPLQNLESVLHERMGALGINTLFQSQDVFNKKKRILLFEFKTSFMDAGTRSEILQQTGISDTEFEAVYPHTDTEAALGASVARLDGLPVEVFEKLVAAVQITAGTLELIQTLKTMGYQVALVSNALTPFTDTIGQRLGIDACFGLPAPVNYDAMAFVGEFSGEEQDALDRERIIAQLMEQEGVPRDDITVITDLTSGEPTPPGIRILFDMKLFLDYFNQHILSRGTLLGVLGGFGAPLER
jgi:phosphoserine phosphatase